jgi:hypothetical protein
MQNYLHMMIFHLQIKNLMIFKLDEINSYETSKNSFRKLVLQLIVFKNAIDIINNFINKG